MDKSIMLGQLKKRIKKYFSWKIGSALALLLILAFFVIKWVSEPTEGDSKDSKKSTEPQIAVVAEAATQGDFPVYLNALGTITALRTVTVKSRVDGELIHVAFKEGSLVTAGDLLAEIDPRAFQVQLMQAEGQLRRDQALLKNAQLDLVRYKTLLEQDSIAAQQTHTQQAVVEQHQGTVEIDRGLVADAKLQLSYAKITAPITGRLGLRLVDQGNMVKASDTNGLAVITQISPIAAIFTLPEDNLPAVMQRFKSGETLSVEAYDRGGNNKIAKGQLLAVDNQIDTTTGTVKLKAQFTNEDNVLFSNQFVNIKIKMDTLNSVTIIPTSAIQRGTIGSFVYVVKDDHTVKLQTVSLGPIEGEKIAVIKGLNANELVVVDGADKLRDKVKVKLITHGSTSSGGIPTLPDKPLNNNSSNKKK
ncbi:MAG: MdtA/MuxA family multidrug efflux RND transporter periplasmic adaptor subunit [Methylococcales bacterium]